MRELTVARVVAEALAAAGIPRVYGIIGTSILDFLDTLYDYRERVDFVTTRHEQVAVSAADAEARVTGRPGAAAVHAGPGLLNSMTAVGIAYRDRAPLVLIVGAVRRRLRGTDAWLEVDQEALARPVTVGFHSISQPGDAPEEVIEALRDSVKPPRGPVVLEVREDVWKSKVRVPDDFASRAREAVEPPDAEGEEERFASDVESLLGDAERPLILACGELALDPRFRQEELLGLAEAMGAYIATSGNGRGACPEDHPRCLGRVGFGGGSTAADRALERSDLVVVLGNEFDDITTYAYTLMPEGDILVASLDPSVEKRPAYYDHYKASPLRALHALASRLRGRTERPEWDREVSEARKRWAAVVEAPLRKEYKGLPNPARFFASLDKALPRSRIITAGQGTHVLYAYSYTRIYRPRSFLAATNLGAMSYAFPAAIGAALARPEGAPVVSIVGDGDFLMTVQDLETLRREGVKAGIVVVNDNCYKVLYLRQVIQLGGRVYETLLGNPDFQKLAEAFDIPFIRVESDSDIPRAVEALARQETPILVELPVSKDDLPPLNLDYTLKMSSA
ncbi:MAG: thiamine pyrophosphate-binding protein [Desulfurococcales archaeon]|nr:thiamine pyrophosphate-binding protein [Desulfurococcales archaeon]